MRAEVLTLLGKGHLDGKECGEEEALLCLQVDRLEGVHLLLQLQDLAKESVVVNGSCRIRGVVRQRVRALLWNLAHHCRGSRHPQRGEEGVFLLEVRSLLSQFVNLSLDLHLRRVPFGVHLSTSQFLEEVEILLVLLESKCIFQAKRRRCGS